MTIDEAIKRLEVFKKDVSECAPELLDDAIQLGIEALKRVLSYKKAHIGLHYIPMLGETKE